MIYMKKWEKFEDYLHRGDWHIHTNYTDGKNTIADYCHQAIKNRLKLIAFTEHVNQNLTYDFDKFISDARSAKEKFNLKILYGCEAKVLDLNGTLNAPEDILKKCELVLGVFHSFPYNDKQNYLKALKNMLKNPYVDVWAHPTLFTLNKFKLTKDEVDEVIQCCMQNNVLIEKNVKYNVPDRQCMKVIKKKWKFTLGSDAHNISELLKKEELARLTS
jgi:DNA polymerase (family 10)/putative hydrolase